MTPSRSFGSLFVLLTAFAAGAVVTGVLGDGRRKSAREPSSAESAAAQVRHVQDALPPLEPPAMAPAVTPPTVASRPPPDVDRTQTVSAAFAEDVQQLRGEVARLKQELGQARVDSQAAVLRDVDSQVAGIRAQLAENQAVRDDSSEAARRAAEQTHQAVLMLFAANRRLTTGDSDVLDSLDAAAPALPYPAQTALRNVRDSIESRNLYTARYWLGVAIVESGWSQLSH